MANSSFFLQLFISSLLITALIIDSLSTTVEASRNHHQRWSWAAEPAKCQGSIAECMAGGELEVGWETNRNVLGTINHISYGALKGNTVPCSLRGQSYYNCQPGAEANPYQRGCSALARCRM